MPEGKSITVMPGEYKELDGLPAGSKVKLEITATLEGDDNQERTLVFDQVSIETEGMADRELKQIARQDNMAMMGGDSKGYSEDF